MAGKVLKKVFGNTSYLFLALLTTWAFGTLALWLPNFSLVTSYLRSGVGVLQKLQFLWGFYGTLYTNHTLYSAGVTVFIALLSGINIALLVYYTKRVQRVTAAFRHVYATSYLGILAGFLGVGCVACGSVILTAVLATLGAGGLLLALPFNGAEVGMVALVILLASNYLLIKKIHEPFAC